MRNSRDKWTGLYFYRTFVGNIFHLTQHCSPNTIRATNTSQWDLDRMQFVLKGFCKEIYTINFSDIYSRNTTVAAMSAITQPRWPRHNTRYAIGRMTEEP
jgi:hypothetical protein